MINSILNKVSIPELYTFNQTFARQSLRNYTAVLKDKLSFADIKPGQVIAITAGSRGIAGYKNLIYTITQFVKSKGAKPILVPSMGSHGGGVFEGQSALLEHFGITEDIAKIVPGGNDVELGKNIFGNPVTISKAFLDADGIIILNRIKPHTSFRGNYESGIVKMAAIGMGGATGAGNTHAAGFSKMADNILSAAKVIFAKTNIICAVATIENAYGEVAEIDVLKKDEILEKEPLLLKKAWSFMPKLPRDEIDVLIIDKIGKDISGTGMDTNIVGRYHTTAAFGGPSINKIVVLSLSDKANGNANGIGLADFTTRRLYDQIDFESTYLNVLTSTEPASAKIPPVMDTDELAIKAAIYTCNKKRLSDITIIRIKNTKQLDKIKVSNNLL